MPTVECCIILKNDIKMNEYMLFLNKLVYFYSDRKRKL